MNEFKRSINWIKTRSIVLAGFIKNARFNTDGSAAVTADINNVLVKGNSRQNIPCVFPYGYLSVPKDGVNAIMLNTGESGSNPLLLGTIVGMNKLPYSLKSGESCQFSNNWLLVQQNEAICAYKINNAEYKATLASGEWLGKYLTDILNRLQTIEQYLNTHTHAGVQTGTGISGIAKPIAPDENIAKDKASINHEEFLLNDNAKSVTKSLSSSLKSAESGTDASGIDLDAPDVFMDF